MALSGSNPHRIAVVEFALVFKIRSISYMKRESLQQLSGLSDIDPIYGVMGIVDEYFSVAFGDTYVWDEIHQRIPAKKLLDILFDNLGFPLIQGEGEGEVVANDNVSLEQVDRLQEFLKRNGEIYFADLIGELKKKVKPFDIRCMLMWIFANIEYLKERETGPRSIFAGNVIDGPFV